MLIDEQRLQTRVRELGAEISADYAGRELLLVGVLKGAVFFMADLMRAISVPCEIDFMAISSYGASHDSSGVVRILKDLDINIEGRHVLVVEDIIDSGLTLSYLVRNLESREPASLGVCALLTKPDRREIDVEVRYVGFEIPNRFVVGYGLDFDERYRNLPYVGVLDAELLAEGVEPDAVEPGAEICGRPRKRHSATLTRRLNVNRLFRSAFIPLIAIVLVVWLASNTLMSKSAATVPGIGTYSQLQTWVKDDTKPSIYEVVFDPSKRAITATLGSKSGESVTVHYPSDASALEFQNTCRSTTCSTTPRGSAASPGRR